MINMKTSNKILLVSLSTNLLASLIYLLIYCFGWGFFFDNTVLIMIVIGLYVVIMIPKAILEKVTAKPIDRAVSEKHVNGYLSEETIEKVNESHYKISKYGFLMQNIALLVSYSAGILFLRDISKLDLFQNLKDLIHLMSIFFLASIAQIMIYNLIISRIRIKLKINYFVKDKIKAVSIRFKVIITVIALMIMASDYMFFFVNVSMIRLPYEKGVAVSGVELANINDPKEQEAVLRRAILSIENIIGELEKNKEETLGLIENYSKEGFDKKKFYEISSKVNENSILKMFYEMDNIGSKFFVIVLIITVLVGCFVVVLLTRDIKFQIDTINNKISKINKNSGKKDLSSRLYISSIDEIGSLTDNFNNVLDSRESDIAFLKELYGQVSDSEKILNESIANFSDIIYDINEKTREINTDSGSQMTIVEDVREDMVKMMESISGTNSKVSQQAALIEQTSTTINEMMRSIISVTSLVDTTTALMSSVTSESKKGSELITQSNRKMDEIKAHSDKVSEKIQIVSGVAKKTNLLAMNASIEAAHAGQSGKGFTVVAEEIRKLAETTTQSSKEIIDYIMDMVSLINEGVEISKNTGDIFGDILSNIIKSNNHIENINSTLREQETGAKEIIASMTDMVESSESIKDFASIQNDRSVKLTKSAEEVRRSASTINNNSNAQTEKVRFISSAVSSLESITEENKKIILKLGKMTEGYIVRENIPSKISVSGKDTKGTTQQITPVKGV